MASRIPARVAGGGARRGFGGAVGLVGLPNVGKSTTFNALVGKTVAQAANYPFCTIEPNKAAAICFDPRLEQLAEISGTDKIIRSTIDIVDIAGLIKGAATGQGLGNQFLSAVRGVNVIAHVIRCFDDADVIHVDEEGINPVRDVEVIETELLLADLQSVEKRLGGGKGRRKQADPLLTRQFELLEAVLPALEDGRPASDLEAEMPSLLDPASKDREAWLGLQLLSQKPMLYIANVDEGGVADGNEHASALEAFVSEHRGGAPVVRVSAGLEADIAAEEEDRSARAALLADMTGDAETGLDRVVAESMRLLGVQQFFTTGKQETRSWPVRAGASAEEAAACIHSDIAQHFVRAEVMAFDAFVELGGFEAGRAAGKVRLEGRDYPMADGDVVVFKHTAKGK